MRSLKARFSVIVMIVIAAMGLCGVMAYADDGSGNGGDVNVYLLTKSNGDIFYTADNDERDQFVAQGWTYRGVAFTEPATVDFPIYRECNPNASINSYNYTISQAEHNDLISIGWNDEGIAWYGCDTGVPIYRLYNSNSGGHFYTASEQTCDAMVADGWISEGLAGWYALAAGDASSYAMPVIPEASLSISPIPDQVYTGDVIKPKPTVSSMGKTLVEGKDYTVEYWGDSQVNSSLHVVNVVGKGDYAGLSAQQPFKIVAASIEDATVTCTPASLLYDGTAKKTTVNVSVDGKHIDNYNYTVSYSDNVEVGTATVTVTGKENYKGVAVGHFSIVSASAPKQSMFRLYNPNSGEHFYTAAQDEHDNLVSEGWNDEGIGWTAPETSNTPVYRMYNPNAGEHHYCMDESEKDMLVDAGWNYEGIGWYSDDAQTVPLYRDYNPNEFANNHNYTTDKSEHDNLVSLGWRWEGYAWYGVAG